DFRRTASRDDRSQLSPGWQPAADVINQFAESNAADLELVVALFLNVSAHAQEPGSCIIRFADFCVFGPAHPYDMLYVAEGLDIVDDRRAHVQAQDSGKVGGLDARIRPLAFH